MQQYKMVKQYLTNNFQLNDSHKSIIETNTASCAIASCQRKLKNWFDIDFKILGDTALVIAERDLELKFMYTMAFTNTPFDTLLHQQNQNTLQE